MILDHLSQECDNFQNTAEGQISDVLALISDNPCDMTGKELKEIATLLAGKRALISDGIVVLKEKNRELVA